MVSDGVGKNEEREKENMIVKKDCINFLEKPKTNRAQHVQTDLSNRKYLRRQSGFNPITFIFRENSNYWRESLFVVITQNIAG